MTILGFGIAPGGQRAAVWADTEIYRDKSACGHALKIFGNPAVMAVAAVTGPLTLIHTVGAFVQKAVTFDDLIEGLRARLKRSFDPEHSLALAARAPKSSSTAVLVGWSEKYARFVGYVLHRELGFAPQGAAHYASPAVADYDGCVDMQSIVAVAQQQFATIVNSSVIAGDGALIVAEMAPTEIRMRHLFDLKTDQFLRRPRDLSATALDGEV